MQIGKIQSHKWFGEKGELMRIKRIMSKCMWAVLVILISFLMVAVAQTVSKKIQIDEVPALRYYVTLFWEILKEIAVFLPVWLMSLLGLVRSFGGEDWFPFAEKIPIRVTKIVMLASVILMACVLVAERIYLKYTTYPFWERYTIEERFGGWQTLFAWILFYGMLLYIEQWCIHRNDSRQTIRKKQAWVTVTLFLTWLILFELNCVELWYTPLERVGDLNTLEDYNLWWFSLYCAAFCLPLWFFSARKTVRLFKHDAQWLMLYTIIPKRITALITLASTGLMVWQLWESRTDRAGISFFDIPEYLEAAAKGHIFQAMIWGLVLFYSLCLLAKQIRSTRKIHHQS